MTPPKDLPRHEAATSEIRVPEDAFCSTAATLATGSGQEVCPSGDEDLAACAQTILHASCVALDGRGLLILGASGSGKSNLALDMIALGAGLVADDKTVLTRRGGSIVATVPPAIAGRIEARYVGLIRMPACPEAELALAIDLDRVETQRLPPRREIRLLGLAIPLLHRPPRTHAASAMFQCLMDRREAP